MVKPVRRYEVYRVKLDPTQGSEIEETRPCVTVSPMTSTQRDYPTRVNLTFQRKKGQVVLDQIRTVDKSRLVKRLGVLPEARARKVAGVLEEMFAYGD